MQSFKYYLHVGKITKSFLHAFFAVCRAVLRIYEVPGQSSVLGPLTREHINIKFSNIHFAYKEASISHLTPLLFNNMNLNFFFQIESGAPKIAGSPGNCPVCPCDKTAPAVCPAHVPCQFSSLPHLPPLPLLVTLIQEKKKNRKEGIAITDD